MKAVPFPYHKLIIGLLTTASNEEEHVAEAKLQEFYGPVDVRSPRWKFTFTNYYDAEMGSGIERYFLSFQVPIDPQQLPDVKRRTNELEQMFMHGENRRINIDPGIISFDRLILATTKDRGHRIPLRDGIYGEVTLMYVNRQFIPLPWTYADYRSEACLKFFKEIRGIMVQQRKKNLR